MDKKAFRAIIAECPVEFGRLNNLAEKLRSSLFPIREDSLFTGTYHDSDKIYMIEAFEREVAS
jgi:hypothetical protein